MLQSFSYALQTVHLCMYNIAVKKSIPCCKAVNTDCLKLTVIYCNV